MISKYEEKHVKEIPSNQLNHNLDPKIVCTEMFNYFSCQYPMALVSAIHHFLRL